MQNIWVWGGNIFENAKLMPCGWHGFKNAILLKNGSLKMPFGNAGSTLSNIFAFCSGTFPGIESMER